MSISIVILLILMQPAAEMSLFHGEYSLSMINLWEGRVHVKRAITLAHTVRYGRIARSWGRQGSLWGRHEDARLPSVT